MTKKNGLFAIFAKETEELNFPNMLRATPNYCKKRAVEFPNPGLSKL
jgi:hypothetical protein